MTVNNSGAVQRKNWRILLRTVLLLGFGIGLFLFLLVRVGVADTLEAMQQSDGFLWGLAALAILIHCSTSNKCKL